MSLAWRLGQFLVFIGLLTLIVFIISIQAGRINLVFCLSSLLLLMTGGYALWRGRKPELPPDARFRSLRKLRNKRKKGKNG
jgi:hypothetical protein